MDHWPDDKMRMGNIFTKNKIKPLSLPLQLWIKIAWYHRFHSGFVVMPVVWALESFQRVSVSIWEPASNIVFVSNETTLKLMPLPALWRLGGQSLAPAVLGVTPTFLKKQVKIKYDKVSWYTRSSLKPAPEVNCITESCPFRTRTHMRYTGSTAVFIETGIEVSCLQSWLVSPPQAVLHPWVGGGGLVDILRMFHKRTRSQNLQLQTITFS